MLVQDLKSPAKKFMRVVAIISVGKDAKGIPYYIQAKENIRSLINDFEFDVRVLTDTPENFNDLGCSVYKYEKKIFNYFDKFFFSFKLIRELNQGIIYIDCDCIDYLLRIERYRNIFSDDKVLYLSHWGVKNLEGWESRQYIKDFKSDPWILPIVQFFEEEKFDFSNLETMFERLFYFPIGLDYDSVEYELEKIKPVFDYASRYGKKIKYRLIYGHGEGLALSYALDVNKIKKETLESNLIFREKYDKIFSYTNDVKNLI